MVNERLEKLARKLVDEIEMSTKGCITQKCRLTSDMRRHLERVPGLSASKLRRIKSERMGESL